MKKIGYIIGIISILGVLGIGGLYFYQDSLNDFEWGDTSQVDGKIILYIEDDCELCQVIEDYIEEEKITQDQVQVQDIVQDQNFQEFQDAAGRCDLLPRSVEVPFLWNGDAETCFRQTPDIITFLEEEVK